MAAASLQQYKELGESMGLSGEKLSEFVREQQAADRADRQAEREREEKRAEREAQEKERERQAQKEEREHRELCALSLMASRMFFLKNVLLLCLCHSVIFLRYPSKITFSLPAGKRLISYRSIKKAVRAIQITIDQSHLQQTAVR